MNSGKCYLFVSGNKCEHVRATIADGTIREKRTVKLLVIKIDNELKFDKLLKMFV